MCFDFLAKTKFSLQNHLLTRHDFVDEGIRVYACLIDGCDYKSVQPQNLEAHVNVNHFGHKKRFLCQLCGKGFHTQGYLDGHVEGVHHNNRKFQCAECPFKTFTLGNLRSHRKAVHMEPLEERKKHPCETCGVKFISRPHMERHVRLAHHNIKQFRCKICNVFFSADTNLKEHIGIKHMGFKNAKEWRRPENKETRSSAARHEAFEFLPLPQENHASGASGVN